LVCSSGDPQHMASDSWNEKRTVQLHYCTLSKCLKFRIFFIAFLLKSILVLTTNDLAFCVRPKGAFCCSNFKPNAKPKPGEIRGDGVPDSLASHIFGEV
jgi:hypothetical protein